MSTGEMCGPVVNSSNVVYIDVHCFRTLMGIGACLVRAGFSAESGEVLGVYLQDTLEPSLGAREHAPGMLRSCR